MIGRTPILGLPYGTTDWHNRAVERLDHALLYGPDGNVLVRNDLHVQGDLTVDGDTNIGGPATQLDANGTILDVDAITDGEILVRSGTSIVSAAVPSSAADALVKPRLHSTAGWYPPTFSDGTATVSLSGVNNTCRLSPIWMGASAGAPMTIGAIGFHGINWDSLYRFGFYALDPDTLLPTSLLYSGLWTTGVISNVFTQTTLVALSLANFTTTEPWIGLAVRVEGIVSDTLSGFRGNNANTAKYAPYGNRPSGTLSRPRNTLLSSDTTPGAMPSAASFAPVSEAINYDHGMLIQLAA